MAKGDQLVLPRHKGPGIRALCLVRTVFAIQSGIAHQLPELAVEPLERNGYDSGGTQIGL